MNESVLSIVGNTPLIKLNRAIEKCPFNLYAKLELLNPGGSSKDRPATAIIRSGIADGSIRKDTIVVESSSGNMGIGMAQACLYYGLRFICVVDPKTTSQNIRLLRLYNAEIDLVRTPDPATGEYLPARLKRVQQLLQSTPSAFWPNQYGNPYNAMAHQQTMREIRTALNGRVDYVFCAVSTCGTLRGCADHIRSNALSTKLIAVDATGSVIFGRRAGRRLIPGHGASIVPQLFRSDLASEYIHVSDLDCVVGCRRLLAREALLAGGSAGGVLMAIDYLKTSIPKDSICVGIFADRGERYVDTIYSNDWVQEHFGDSWRGDSMLTGNCEKEECLWETATS